MKLSSMSKYKEAQAALISLQEQSGRTPGILAIATFLLYAAEADVPERLIPYVGDPSSAQDRAVVESYTEAMRSFVAGEDVGIGEAEQF